MSAPLCHSLPTVSDPGDTCADTLALHRGILCAPRPWRHARRNRNSVHARRFWPSFCEAVPTYEYENLPKWLERRPTKRSECPPPDQQCPWVSCRYHLALDAAGKKRPRVKVWTHPDDWTANTPTCALHVAEQGAHTLLDIGAILGDISRERVRQIEQSAQAKLSKVGIILSLAEDCDLDTTPFFELTCDGFSARKIVRQGPARDYRTHREPIENLAGSMAGEVVTAAMRRAIGNAQHLPIRTVTLPPEELARVESEIEAKRKGKPAPTGQRKPSVTADTLTRLAHDPRYAARSRESLRSFRRLTAPDAPSAKAPTTTTPRPPSPPSTPSPEIPPQIPPTTIQSDDYSEVAVAAALPDPTPAPPQPTPTQKPMPRPTRAAFAKAHAWAIAAIKSTLAVRKMSQRDLIATVQARFPALDTTYVQQGVSDVLAATGSPVSVWFRRVATALDVALSDLCDSPEWVSAVIPEDSPLIRAHRHRGAAPTLPPAAALVPVYALSDLPRTIPAPPYPDTPTRITPIFESLTAAQNQLSHVAGAAAHLEARTTDLEALAKVLRDEIDDLQQQLAERTRERDAATATLARIKAAL